MLEQIISVEELADFFNRDVRTVQLWAKNEGMPKNARGEYDILKCAQWKIRNLEEENEILRNSGDEKLYALKSEGQKIANKERELKLRKALKELVDVESVRIAWLGEMKIFSKALKALINKLSAALDGVEDREQRREIIERLVREVMTMIGELKITDTVEGDELDGIEAMVNINSEDGEFE